MILVYATHTGKFSDTKRLKKNNKMLMLGLRLGVKTQNNGHNARYPVSYIVHLSPDGLATTFYMHKHTHAHGAPLQTTAE